MKDSFMLYCYLRKLKAISNKSIFKFIMVMSDFHNPVELPSLEQIERMDQSAIIVALAAK
jgi:hypothetical protein